MAGMTHPEQLYVVPRVLLEKLSDFLDKVQDEAVQTPSALLQQFVEEANVLQFKINQGVLQQGLPKVYLVIEDEPETNTDFPSVVVSAHWTQTAANARVAKERADHGLEDEDAYADSDKTWTVESHEVEP